MFDLVMQRELLILCCYIIIRPYCTYLRISRPRNIIIIVTKLSCFIDRESRIISWLIVLDA